jgi:diguanylate cyclase (GGDEF)-like protein/PAS domain S-box-containing protein
MAGHEDIRQTSRGVWEPTTRNRAKAPDVSGARIALEHLSARRAAKHASAVIASIQDGLVTVDERGRIVDVNAVLCDMTGFHRLRLLGSRAPYPFWAHADAHDNARAIAGLLKGEFAEGGSCRLMFCRADGERFAATVAIAPLRDAEGISIGFAATIRETADAPSAAPLELAAAGLLRCEAAMEHVAAAVSAEVPASQVYQLIAEEAALLVGADAARIARIDDGGATMMGAWSKPGFDPRQSGGTALSADVRFGNRRWGVLQTNTAAGRTNRPQAQEELSCFATLATLALAIGTMDERSRTAPERDPLTGFAAREELERRVAADVDAARATDGNVAFIAIELDQFRGVDLADGSELDEHTLRQVADRLGRVIRRGDTLGRLRSGAFGWVLPGADASAARDAANRALSAIAGIDTPGEPPISVTVGVSDLGGVSADARDLVRHAEIALHDAKRAGATIVAERAADAPAKRDRAALQILARVVESQDPAARGSAERVSELAELLALELGWSGDRAALLGEAAYVRDIGKIGLAGPLLLKPAQLSEDERETMKRHATLSAEMIDGILTGEQVEWVRHHHERYDGAGYPDGLSGDRIPEGARILGLADAWDAMTNDRCYQDAMPVADALVDCVLESGWQFCPVAVEALRGLVSAGAAPITCPDRRRSTGHIAPVAP